MDITIRFVGGPADGRTLAIPDASPPPLYLIPLAPSIAELMNASLDPSPIQKAEYEPQFEGGLFRVAGDGAYLYRHRAAPLTPEKRDALARKREEARAAEARRAAELDETWQEIRRERPGYPEDWRDL
ncbi:hypothetical protein ACFWD7_06635 [Streptomyces mirabilis]|uniref:hypothetical protein n=1 Tax=Streptomyces mirabilis TaxID=68239 RepID=UPI0036769EFA